MNFNQKYILNKYQNDGISIIPLNAIQKIAKENMLKKIKKGIYTQEYIICPICESNNFDVLSEKDRYGLPLSVSLCTYCGLLMTNPRMNQGSYDLFYKEDQKKLYVGEDIPTEKYFEKLYKRGESIFSYVNQYTNNFQRILEIGCSSGGVLKYFKDQGKDVRGCDLNETYIEYGKKSMGLDLYATSLENLVFEEWVPDLVIYSHTLEHILNPIEIKNEIEVFDIDWPWQFKIAEILYREITYGLLH